MILTGTVVVDSSTVIEDGAVVVDGSHIEAVGHQDKLFDQYGDLESHSYDVLLPGFVGGHIHSVQSLGRGIADDTELLDWLFDYVLPMEASLSADEMAVAAKLGYIELIENGTTTCIDHLSVSHADRAFEAAGEVGIRGVLGKVLMDQRSPDALEEDTDQALAESERLIQAYHGGATRVRRLLDDEDLNGPARYFARNHERFSAGDIAFGMIFHNLGRDRLGLASLYYVADVELAAQAVSSSF